MEEENTIRAVVERWVRFLHKAIEKWGAQFQMDMAIEECSEFIGAVQKYRRGRCGEDEVVDEIADVIIMMAQMVIVFSGGKVFKRIKHKMNRLEKRLRETRDEGDGD